MNGDGCPPLERIAALIDGRLDAAGRAAVERHLASCPRCFEIWSETLRTLQATEISAASGADASGAEAGGADAESAEVEEIEPQRVRGGSEGRRRGAGRVLPLALAAAALIAVLYPLGRTLLWSSSEPERLVAHLPEGATLRQGLGAEWSLPVWSGFRGSAPAVQAPPRTAFRLGARAVDLEAAYRAGDRAAAAEIALDLARLHRGLQGAEDLALAYEILGRDLAGDKPLHAVRQEYGWLAGESDRVEPRDRFELGAWAEAGRLAARARVSRHFGSREWVRGLERWADVPEVLALEASSAADPPELAALESALEELVALGGDGRL